MPGGLFNIGSGQWLTWETSGEHRGNIEHGEINGEIIFRKALRRVNTHGVLSG
jgi:hypothetical protein